MIKMQNWVSFLGKYIYILFMMKLTQEVMQLCAYLTEILARYRSVLRNIFIQTSCSGETKFRSCAKAL
jgi:hypothetical protein